MPNAISNTSPLLYLGRAGIIEWLPKLFEEIWIPQSVANELLEGHRQHGLITHVRPLLNQLENTGMWISADIQHRILALANETDS